MDKCEADCWDWAQRDRVLGRYFAGTELVLEEGPGGWSRVHWADGTITTHMSRETLEDLGSLAELARGNEEAERLLNGH